MICCCTRTGEVKFVIINEIRLQTDAPAGVDVILALPENVADIDLRKTQFYYKIFI
jgi:hypothetical protein